MAPDTGTPPRGPRAPLTAPLDIALGTDPLDIALGTDPLDFALGAARPPFFREPSDCASALPMKLRKSSSSSSSAAAAAAAAAAVLWLSRLASRSPEFASRWPPMARPWSAGLLNPSRAVGLGADDDDSYVLCVTALETRTIQREERGARERARARERSLRA